MKLFELTQYTLKEGGNAIKSSVSINQENVAATMNEIEKVLLPKLNISKKDTASLGSTGKKGPGQQSGDIDLAVSVQALTQNNGLETPAELYGFLIKVSQSFTSEIKDMRGIGLISLAWPITNVDGKQEGEVVQLDLMTVDSIDWARWAYYAPSFDQSPYKGLYRNEIFYALARYMDYKTISRAMDNAGEEVDSEWQRHFFDLGKGLMHGEQNRIGKKGIVKGVKTVNKVLKSLDPREVVKMFFGPNAEPNDILTFEQALAAVLADDFAYAKDRAGILAMTKQGILNKGYPVPPELDAVA